MDFTALMNMFAPKPDMDPFAIGRTLSDAPDAMAPQLATMGPPPPAGQSFGDWLASKFQGGAMPPTQPNAYGNAMNPRMGGPFPKTPQPDDALTGPFSANPTAPSPLIPNAGQMTNALPAAPGYTGVENVPGVGPVPTTGAPLERDLDSGPTPASAITKKPTQLAANVPLPRPRPEIPAEKPKEAGAKVDPAKQKAIQDALKGMSGLLSGLKQPPAPETQKISSPSVPRPTGTIQGGGITALINQLTGVAPQVSPLRLGNALYAGGRGLY